MFPLRDTISWSRFPAVVTALIALNVLIFVYQWSLGSAELQRFLMEHALVPRRYFVPSWGGEVGLSPTDVTPFLTNMFLHGGLLHIATNLWTLWIFGPALEDRLGSARFTALYLISGLAASLMHAVFNASSPIPAMRRHPSRHWEHQAPSPASLPPMRCAFLMPGSRSSR